MKNNYFPKLKVNFSEKNDMVLHFANPFDDLLSRSLLHSPICSGTQSVVMCYVG